MQDIVWTPGQVVDLANRQGDTRRFSVVSRKAEHFLELHLRQRPGGAVSGWAASLSVGDTIHFDGPTGDFTYDDSLAARPLLLIGTGAAGGVLAGIAHEAAMCGHRAPIQLFHGVRDPRDMFLSDHIADLPEGRVHLVEAVAHHATGTARRGRAADLAFARPSDLSETAVFLAGAPQMVETARRRALRGGAAPALIRTAAFTASTPLHDAPRPRPARRS